MLYGAVVLAGGRGTRFHGRKQFMEMKGKPLWQHVFDKARNVLETYDCQDNIVAVGVEVPGGEYRSGSVQNGLQALNDATERVIILEAARPLVTKEQIETLLLDKSESASFVMPLVNTVVGRDGMYYDRSLFYDLLTPQAFDYQKLCDAYKTGKYVDMTDETRIMFEEYGCKPHFLETGDNLIKVTYPRDVAVITALIEERPELL